MISQKVTLMIISLFFSVSYITAMDSLTEQLCENNNTTTVEQKHELTSSGYQAQQHKYREKITALVFSIIHNRYQAVNTHVLEPYELLELSTAYAEHLIALYEGHILKQPINVTNEASAFARSAQFLSSQEKQVLCLEHYRAQKPKALLAIARWCELTITQLKQASIFPYACTENEYQEYLMHAKINLLEKISG